MMVPYSMNPAHPTLTDGPLSIRMIYRERAGLTRVGKGLSHAPFRWVIITTRSRRASARFVDESFDRLHVLFEPEEHDVIMTGAGDEQVFFVL